MNSRRTGQRVQIDYQKQNKGSFLDFNLKKKDLALEIDKTYHVDSKILWLRSCVFLYLLLCVLPVRERLANSTLACQDSQ